MKKTVLTLIAVAMMTTAMAQPQGGPRGPRMDRKEMVAKRTNDMKDKYSLTAEQVEKVTALNEKFFAQPAPKPQPPTDANTGATAQKKDNTSDKKSDKKADKKDKKKDNAQQAPRQNDGQHRQGGPRGPRGFGFNFQQYNEELKTILTPEQYKKYESDMQQMRQRRPRQ